MTASLSDRSSYLIAFGVPVIFILAIVALVNSPIFDQDTELLSAAITIDLLLTVPIIHYFLIRKKNIPKTTPVFFFIVGIVIASFILPKEYQSLLNIAKFWVLPMVEVTVFGLIGYKIYSIVKEFKAQKEGTPDAFSAIKKASSEIIPGRIASVLAAEIGVYYYGFITWKKPELRDNQFTYHKRNAVTSVFGALILIIGVETIGVHLLLSLWSTVAAWILTAISIYTLFQVIGIAKSLSRRPISIDRDTINLRYGLLNETSIRLDNIESIEYSTTPIKDNPEILPLSPLGELDGHNTIITVKEECELSGFYGSKKRFTSIAFNVDDVDAFKSTIAQAL